MNRLKAVSGLPHIILKNHVATAGGTHLARRDIQEKDSTDSTDGRGLRQEQFPHKSNFMGPPAEPGGFSLD